MKASRSMKRLVLVTVLLTSPAFNTGCILTQLLGGLGGGGGLGGLLGGGQPAAPGATAGAPVTPTAGLLPGAQLPGPTSNVSPR